MYSELIGYNRQSAYNQTEKIYDYVLDILNKSESEGIHTQLAAIHSRETHQRHRQGKSYLLSHDRIYEKCYTQNVALFVLDLTPGPSPRRGEGTNLIAGLSGVRRFYYPSPCPLPMGEERWLRLNALLKTIHRLFSPLGRDARRARGVKVNRSFSCTAFYLPAVGQGPGMGADLPLQIP